MARPPAGPRPRPGPRPGRFEPSEHLALRPPAVQDAAGHRARRRARALGSGQGCGSPRRPGRVPELRDAARLAAAGPFNRL